MKYMAFGVDEFREVNCLLGTNSVLPVEDEHQRLVRRSVGFPEYLLGGKDQECIVHEVKLTDREEWFSVVVYAPIPGTEDTE